MLITYYEDGSSAPKPLSLLLLALMLANGAFAAAILFAWTYVSLVVAEPLSWATWMPISRGYGITGVLDYPFIILWMLPLIGIFGAWVGVKGGRKTLAYSFVAIPLVMLALIFGWYYITPSDWR
ncbi:MAG: hypothetical protein SFW09_05130 [Hyphomicrobiaceae bacterium]|nr:hypothetical protein [Hyphomicrobiaceae bacterium]